MSDPGQRNALAGDEGVSTSSAVVDGAPATIAPAHDKNGQARGYADAWPGYAEAGWWLHGYLTASGPARIAQVRWAARRYGKPAGLGQNNVTAAARALGLRRVTDGQGRGWWVLPGGDR